MPRIIIDENIPLLKEALHPSAETFTAAGRAIDNKMLKELSADAVVVRSVTKLDEQLLSGTNVRFAGTSTSGFDNADINYLRKAGIEFAYAPGSNANSVAEYVVWSILSWANENNINLKEIRAGIIGYGNIGRIVADYLHKLGMKVFVNDPPLNALQFNFPEFISYKHIDEILSECEVITNHVPLTYSGEHLTLNLINERRIDLIKEGALFFHISRGGVVDEQALLKKLKRNDLTAVVDVWDNEPDVNSQLAERCMIATPHIAGYSYDGKLKGALMMCESIENTFGIKTNKESICNELNSVSKHIGADSNPSEIFTILDNNRKFLQDNLEFKKTLYLDNQMKITSFDLLRKNYPKRRETLI